MRRFTIGSAMVLALLLMLTAIATAAPPVDDWCGERGTKQDHPSCSDTTTSTTQPPAVQPCKSGPLPVGIGNYLQCEWTPQEGSSTVGTVTVEVVSGQIGGLAIFVLDSLPGNICVLEQINKPTGHESASFPLVAEDEKTYWSTGGIEWCAQYDEYGTKEDRNGEPLLVRVKYRAKKGTVVNISFSPVDIADTQ
jgi:hypothetical protein